MIELRVLQEGETERSHSHQNYELLLVLSGTAHIFNGPMNITLQKDEMFFINSNVKHKCEVNSGSIVISFMISYSEVYKIIELPYLNYDLTPTHEKIVYLTELRKVLKNIISLSMRGSKLDGIKLYKLYADVLRILFSEFSNWTPTQLDDGMIAGNDRMQTITNYIINNYQQQISLQQLADNFGMSVPYLSKYLKRNLGMGFVQYLNNIRLHHAAEELIQTAKPVTKIAFDNGFTNLTSFNHMFKEVFLSTPSEYRKNNIRQENEVVPQNSHSLSTSKLLGEYLAKQPFTLMENSDVEIIRTDVTFTPDPPKLARNWNTVISFGAASKLLESRMQEHVLLLFKSLNYTRLRIWGLFDEECGIDKNSPNKFNFTKINQIFDFLYNNGITPCIDLGFLPDTVYGALNEVIRYKESDIQFTKLEQYDRLLTQFIKNLINRYSMEYVEQCLFELWKDPRLEFEKDPVTFFTVFDVAYRSIKKILPKVQVGGCGLTILSNVDDFEKSLKIWSTCTTKPDFLTISIYPYGKTEDGFKLISDEDYFLRMSKKLKELMKKYGFEDKPLYINEWNITRSSRNSINDSCCKAAFIVKNTIRCLEGFDGMTHSCISDLFSDEFYTTDLLIGGAGLITKDSIKKPSYFAYQFLNKLGSRLLFRNEHCIVTLDHDDIILLCHNYNNPGLDYYLHYNDSVKPTEVASLFGVKNVQMFFNLKSLPGREYVIKKYRLNTHSGSILDLWIETGMTETVSKEEIDYYQSVCMPQLSSETVIVKNSSLQYETLLENNEIQLIYFKLQE